MLEDLPDPTECYKASLLRASEFRSTVLCDLDERVHLLVNGSSTFPLPFWGFVPRSNVAILRVARIRMTPAIHASRKTRPLLPSSSLVFMC